MSGVLGYWAHPDRDSGDVVNQWLTLNGLVRNPAFRVAVQFPLIPSKDTGFLNMIMGPWLGIRHTRTV